MVLKRGSVVRLVIILLIVLSSCSLAFAEVDVVFDKVVSHGTIISLNSTPYEIRIGTVNDSLVKVTSEFESIDLEIGDCLTRKHDTFCYVEWDDVQKIQANLTDAKPLLEVDRDIESKNLDLGERTLIEVTFENVGGSKISDFYFYENVPSLLTVINASGCSISKDDEQKIILDTNLFPDTSQTCTYVVEAGDVGTAAYAGTYKTKQLVSSLDGEAVPQAVITTENVFNLDITSSKYDIAIGQPIILTFSIENLETGTKGSNLTIHNITINIEDTFGLKTSYPSEFYTFSNPELFKFSGIVPPDTTLEQKVELEPITVDENISLELFVSYQLGTDDISSFKRVIPFTQQFIPLSCDYLVVDDAGNNLISLEKLNHTLPGFDKGELFVYIYNENQYISFDDIKVSSKGDIDFPNRPRTNSLRKNDEEILTSKLFSFDKTENFEVKSSTQVNYKIFGENFESTCNGNIFVEKPSFLDVRKELSFIEIPLTEDSKKKIPRVSISLANNFFLPIRNIVVTEKLPAQIFSNNNTRFDLSLGTLEEETFTYDFIVPDDYAAIDGADMNIETQVTYEIYGQTFTDSVVLSVDANDVISAQKGILLDDLIKTQINELKQELNSSLVANQEKIVINATLEPSITYSPFLNYFSIALIIFLFFFAFVFLNVKYGLTQSIKNLYIKRKATRLAKREKNFAKNFNLYKQKEENYQKKLVDKKKAFKQAKSDLEKLRKRYKKTVASLSLKELSTSKLIDKKQKEISRLQAQKNYFEKEIALGNSSLTSYEHKKQTLEVQKSKEKSILDKKIDEVNSSKLAIAQIESTIKNMDTVLLKLKSDFEKTNDKTVPAQKKKLKTVKSELSHLDDEYASKRKLLKEEEKHLEGEK